MTDDEPAGAASRAQELAVPLVAPSYTSATLLLDEMLADMIASGDFLTDACRSLGLDWRRLYERLAKDVAFADLMNRAQEMGFEVRASLTARIARGDRTAGSSGDWKRDQLIVKQENWLLEKRHPRKYGPKLEIETTNRNMDVPVSDDPVEASKQYDRFIRGT